MKNHEGCKRAFIWSSKAWYRHQYQQEAVSFGMYHTDGSTSGSMNMVWEDLGGDSIPKLECFDDAWNSLAMFSDLIKILGEKDDENITPKDFVDILVSLGFTDNTVYESPYSELETELREELAQAEERVAELKIRLLKYESTGEIIAISER